MKTSLYLAGATLTACFGSGAAFAQEQIQLDYWVYSDFAQGEALELQQKFIDEFESYHPGVTINISGSWRRCADLRSGYGRAEWNGSGRIHEFDISWRRARESRSH